MVGWFPDSQESATAVKVSVDFPAVCADSMGALVDAAPISGARIT